MEREQVERLVADCEIDDAIEKVAQVIEDEYDEYTMLKLTELYMQKGDNKKAKKTLRKLQRLFPAGEYQQEIQRLQKNLSEKSGIPQSIQECFAGSVGMESVAEDLEKFYKLLRLQNDRKRYDYQPDVLKSSHFVVIGDRGSGKTLVGNIIARLLCAFHIRSTDRTVLVPAREILHAYDEKGDPGIEQIFGKASDAVVIVENIQDILLEREDVPLRQIALCLQKILLERKADLSVVLTGNRTSKNAFFEANETLEDAFYSVIEIPSYSAMDLFRIAEKLAAEKALQIHPDAEPYLLHKIDLEYRGAGFMNAISLERYLDEAVEKMADRYADASSGSDADLVYLMPEDFGTEPDGESLESLFAQLDALTGLTSVKEQVRTRIRTVSVENKAREAGIHRASYGNSLHMLFMGNPGTGKTTVARLVGRIYQQLGVLPRGNCIVECTRSNLVEKYVGHTAKKVRQKVREARGGVLFIDEAYALCRGSQDSFGQEAVDELIAAMEDNRDNMLVILAGYSEEMKVFLKTNPGFSSRIRNQIVFEDYSLEEMTEIFHGMIRAGQRRLQEGTEQTVVQLIESKSKAPDFGNARGIRNLVEDVVEAQNARLDRLGKTGEPLTQEQYRTICEEDLIKVLQQKAAGAKSLQELQDELDRLTGLLSVKKKVQEMVDDLTVKELIKQNEWGGKDHGTLHLVFKGNAGTGKTTVARLLGQIYKALGILQKNVFVEVGRKDLVARYMGQTAEKVVQKIKEAEGGILFIDEAYNLLIGTHDEYGQEAVNTLLAEMENRRDRLMVIVAGYGREMDRFLETNQGLASRFANEIIFEDYTPEELQSIFYDLVKQKGLSMEPGLEAKVMELIQVRQAAVKDFGNARGVRNIVEDLEKKKNSRIAARLRRKEQLSYEEIQTLVEEDLTKLEEEYRVGKQR